MRQQKFTFLCNDEERQLIQSIAERLERSQGDALRILIRTAAQELGLLPALPSEKNVLSKGVNDEE